MNQLSNRNPRESRSASSFKLISSNVRGWGDTLKQRKQMIHFQSLDPSIICISETKFDKKKKNNSEILMVQSIDVSSAITCQILGGWLY